MSSTELKLLVLDQHKNNADPDPGMAEFDQNL